jgi:hypothetical protein
MKFSTIIIFLLLSLKLLSQGNLQFNQAITREFTASNLVNISTVVCTPSTITVPTGKVWKIEHASVCGDALGTITTSIVSSILVNNILLFRTPSSFVSTLWLPEGTYSVKIAQEVGNYVSYSYKGSINAIEFNIIP